MVVYMLLLPLSGAQAKLIRFIFFTTGLKLASRVMTAFTVVKLLTFVFIVVVGVVFMIKRRSFPESFEHPFRTVPGLSLSVPSFASSLYGVFWAYTGW